MKTKFWVWFVDLFHWSWRPRQHLCNCFIRSFSLLCSGLRIPMKKGFRSVIDVSVALWFYMLKLRGLWEGGWSLQISRRASSCECIEANITSSDIFFIIWYPSNTNRKWNWILRFVCAEYLAICIRPYSYYPYP